MSSITVRDGKGAVGDVEMVKITTQDEGEHPTHTPPSTPLLRRKRKEKEIDQQQPIEEAEGGGEEEQDTNVEIDIPIPQFREFTVRKRYA